MSLITTIRPALPQEAGVVRELVRAAYAKWVPMIGREPLPMQADYDRALREHRIDILRVEGSVAGLVETMLYPGHLWIENLAVHPGHQGQGHGRRLLVHAEHLAITAERPGIHLLTNAAFAANVAFYGRHGYGVDRQEPFMGGTTVYMSKEVPNPAATPPGRASP